MNTFVDVEEKLVSFEQVLKNVFWNESSQATTRKVFGGKVERLSDLKPSWKVALFILEKVRAGNASRKTFRSQVIKELGISRNKWESVFYKLRDNGFIKIENDKIMFSFKYANRRKEEADLTYHFMGKQTQEE